MAPTTHEGQTTLREAFNDLGWAWLVFTALVGGPSILALLEMIFIDYRLIDALQWIVDSYNRLLALIGGFVEPALQPFVDWINRLFDWRLDLQPHWRPLFVLTALTPSSICRTLWLEKKFGYAFATAALMGLAALVSALAAGVIPLERSWWSHGLVAAVPATLLALTLSVTIFIFEREWRQSGWLLFVLPLVIGAGAFILGAQTATDPRVPALAGLFAFGCLIVGFAGVVPLGMGGRFMNRMGLTVLGGFIAAGAIVAADAALKVLGA